MDEKVCIRALPLMGLKGSLSLEQYLLWYLFPTWKKGGAEGSDDSVPLKCNIFQSLLLSLLVVAGHHYF